MKLTDAERAENRKAFAEMTWPQRVEYIFEYYKFPLVLILIAAVALGSAVYYRVTHREPLLYLGYANIAVGGTLDSALNEGFTRAVGENPRHSEVRIYRNLFLSGDASVQDHQYAYASRLKVMAAITNRQLDVLLKIGRAHV